MGGYYGITPDDIALLQPGETGPNAGGGFSTLAPQAPRPKKPNRLLKTIQDGGQGYAQPQQEGQQQHFNPVQTYSGVGQLAGLAAGLLLADGGYADQPTNVTIGEGGEPEYVVPASKLKGFAAQVAVGSPIDPKLLPPDDGPQYSPITPSMRQAGPPPPPLDTPGRMPQAAGPQAAPPQGQPAPPMRAGPPPLTTPGQPPQLPPVPQMNKPGVLQRLGAAAVGGLGGYVNAAGRSKIDPGTIEGAEQGILHPGYAQKMGQYKLNTERAQQQGKLNTEAAQADHARSQGRLADQQAETLAEEGKKPYITVPGGGLFNVKTGQWVRQPVDRSQLTPIPKEQAEAWGISPLPDGTYALPNSAVGQYISSQKEKAPSVHMIPGTGTVISYTPGEATAKVIYQGDPKVETDLADLQVNGKPHKVLVNKQTGQVVKDLGESGIKPPQVNVTNEARKDKTAGLKAYTPALESAERFNVMTKNYEDAVRSHDQQAMLSLLANHLGMTMGLQKGARLTKDIIHEAENSRPWLQGLAAKFDSNGYLSGVNLTPEQMRQMVSLGRERFAEDMSKGRSEAGYMGVTDDGPTRTPNKATINFFLGLANGDLAKAKELAKADGWSVN